MVVLILFVETENRLYKIGFSVAQKKRNRKNDFFFSVVLFYVPVVKKCLHLSIETPSGMDTWTASHTQQQQQHQRQRKGGVDNVGRLNTSTYYTLQCCMQVHNPLIFHYWFPCILRLSVTPLPKMKREPTSHDPWDCCLFLACVTCYQVCVIFYVLCVA